MIEVNLTDEQRAHLLKWAEALESGKYKQTTGELRNRGGFCCLGVACDVYDPLQWSEDGLYEGAINYGADCDASRLPNAVAQWLGIPEDPPLIGTALRDVMSQAVTCRAGDQVNLSATVWNDAQGANFEQIAAMIRSTYGLPPRVNEIIDPMNPARHPDRS